MTFNLLIKQSGLHTPGALEPDFYETEKVMGLPGYDGPDAVNQWAIEMQRCDNLERVPEEDRANPEYNKQRYKLLSDITFDGPRSNVRDLIPQPELYVETTIDEGNKKLDLNIIRNFRKKIEKIVTANLSRVDNIPNVVEYPERRDLLRWADYNNPRLRGKVRLSPIDNGLTHIQNHYVQNMPFDKKLLKSIEFDTDKNRNKNNQNNINIKRNNMVKKARIKDTKVDSVLSALPHEDSINSQVRKPKEYFNSDDKYNNKKIYDGNTQYSDDNVIDIKNKQRILTTHNKKGIAQISNNGDEILNNNRDKVMYKNSYAYKNKRDSYIDGYDNKEDLQYNRIEGLNKNNIVHKNKGGNIIYGNDVTSINNMRYDKIQTNKYYAKDSLKNNDFEIRGNREDYNSLKNINKFNILKSTKNLPITLEEERLLITKV